MVFPGDKVVQGLEVCDSPRGDQCAWGAASAQPRLGHDDPRGWSPEWSPHVDAAGGHRSCHVLVFDGKRRTASATKWRAHPSPTSADRPHFDGRGGPDGGTDGRRVQGPGGASVRGARHPFRPNCASKVQGRQANLQMRPFPHLLRQERYFGPESGWDVGANITQHIVGHCYVKLVNLVFYWYEIVTLFKYIRTIIFKTFLIHRNDRLYFLQWSFCVWILLCCCFDN